MTKKILILEDNELMIEVMTYILYNNGYEVVSSTYPEKVFDHIKSDHPDLVILDTWKPALDSHEVCRLLKLNVATRNLPVIICSESDDIAALYPDEKCAPNGILQKPFGMNSLIRTIEYQLAA